MEAKLILFQNISKRKLNKKYTVSSGTVKNTTSQKRYIVRDFGTVLRRQKSYKDKLWIYYYQTLIED